MIIETIDNRENYGNMLLVTAPLVNSALIIVKGAIKQKGRASYVLLGL